MHWQSSSAVRRWRRRRVCFIYLHYTVWQHRTAWCLLPANLLTYIYPHAITHISIHIREDCSASKVYVTYINCCRIAIHMCATPVDKDWLVKKCYIRPLLDRQNDIMITAKKWMSSGRRTLKMSSVTVRIKRRTGSRPSKRWVEIIAVGRKVGMA